MKVALCQMASNEDKQHNLNVIEEMSRTVRAEGADLAVFPEFAMVELPALNAEFISHAEPTDGPFVQRVSEIAREIGITIVFGMLEAIEGEERAYNTLLAVSSSGEIVAKYHKAHLYDAFGDKESAFIRPGAIDKPATFEVDGVTVGLLTCYDLRFPEAARMHADAGVELLVYPASWVPGPRKEDHWQTLARARAIENTFYVAAVSQAPKIGTGGSLLIDPMGLVVAELGERVSTAVGPVEPERVVQVRGSNPSLANRRFAVIAA